MALKESELRVLAIIGLIILILWAFFGLFWSLLLVFTFLIYAYNFGRQQRSNSRHEIAEDEPDVSFEKKLHDDYSEFQDLPFTGLPKGQITLRSPMPLLSEVTKRLTFNTSTITPFQERKTYHNRGLGTPYLSRGSPVAYWRKSNHFSLLNPALQRPSTVKIASPDVTINRTFTLSNSPLKRSTQDHVNPCSRATVLSALKESRKRSYAVDEEEDPELFLRPAKRRGTKPVSSSSANTDSIHKGTLLSSRPFFGGLKRAAIHEKKEITDEITNKRSKVIGDDVSADEIVQGQRQTESTMQKRKSTETESTRVTSKQDTAESKSKKAKNSAPKDNREAQRPATVEREDTQMEINSAVTTVTDQETDARVNDNEHKQSVSKRTLSSEVENVEVRKTKQSSVDAKLGEHLDRDDVIQKPVDEAVRVLREKRKRFTVPRFPSKEDSRRRAVPVYCASNEESDMPQRRMVTRKINQEQIKIDRKLAWERVKQFLDDDDEEDDEEGGETSKSGTTALPSTTTAMTSSSLLKIPTDHAASSRGTMTTTTQSLIMPALSTGFPQQTTGTPLATIVPPAGKTVQGNTAVTQSQTSLHSLLQSQQALKGSGLASNLSSVPGLSANVSTALPGTATTKQESLVITTSAGLSNPSSTGLQANVPLTATTTSCSAPGFQLNSSSASSFGNVPFSKSTTTNQLTSLLNPSSTNAPPTSFQLNASIGLSAVGSTLPSTQNSAQAGFSFPTISSSGTSTSSTTSVQAGFNFSATIKTQSTFSLNKMVPQNNPVTGVVTTSNSTNSFALTSNTSQNPVVFGNAGNSLTAASQNPFGSLAKTTAAVSSVNSPSIFGQSTTTAQTSFGLTTQHKGTFGSTNMQSLSGSTQQTQSGFGGTSSGAFGATIDKSSTQNQFSQAMFGAQSNQNASQGAFGSNPTQNTFGTQQSQPAASQSAFGSNLTQNAFGTQQSQPASQSAFGSNPTQSAFGTQQSQPAASQSAFGGKSGLNPGAVKNQNTGTFGSQANQGQSVFGNQASSNTFGSQQKQNTTQSAFGTQATQNAFGAQLTQPTIQNAFGNQATQNAFGGKPNQSTTQSAFGAPTNTASKSSFSFAANTAQTSTNSPFSNFSNNPATQSAFGATPSQNAAASAGGFNFGSPASNPATGGFNFSATSNKTGGFQFGSGGTNGSFGGFGQTSAQTASPLATPAQPAPSGGFNFASGSSVMAGSPFASSTSAPAFGAPSTPQGASSALTAKSRARIAARRRGKK